MANSVPVASFMQLTGSGVYIPAFVEVLVSDDNKDFRKVKQIDNDVPVTQSTLTFKDFRFDLKG